MKYLFIIISFVSLLLFTGCASEGEVVYACDTEDTGLLSAPADSKERSEVGTDDREKPDSPADSHSGAVDNSGLLATTGEEACEIYIAVLGEINNPGIYVLDREIRVFEVINRAGGTTGSADLTGLDLVSVLAEDCTLIIPGESDRKSASTAAGGIVRSGSGVAGSLESTGSSPSEPVRSLVNINTAGTEELITLNGIGATRAQAIIEYRNANGPFREKEDIMNVSGIGEATFGKLKESITVD